MRFRTTILETGKTAAGFEVPPDIVDALGAGKRPKVLVTIRGYTYRSSVAVMGGGADGALSRLGLGARAERPVTPTARQPPPGSPSRSHGRTRRGRPRAGSRDDR
ncbi:MAG: DUF1905 domain-containing protein [Candidatus Limnocylindrales bacterium]